MNEYDPHYQAAFAEEQQQEQPASNPLLIAHRLLRGRYWIAAVLSILFAPPMAYLGFNALPPKFTSEGTVTVISKRQIIMGTVTGLDDAVLANELVQEQVARLKSPRVLAYALSQPKMDSILVGGAKVWPAGPRGVEMLNDAMDIRSSRRSPVIAVGMTHQDPGVAQRTLNVVLDAYNALVVEQENTQSNDRIQRLQDKKQREEAERNSAMARKHELETSEGPSLALLESKLEKAVVLDKENEEIRSEINTLRATKQQVEGAEEMGGVPPEEFSIEALAALDQDRLGKLVRTRADARLQRDIMAMDLGEKHRKIKDMDKAFSVYERQIDERVQYLRDQIAEEGLGSLSGVVKLQRRLRERNMAQDLLGERRQRLNSEIKRLTAVKVDIEVADREYHEAVEELRRVNNLLEQLELERGNKDEATRIAVEKGIRPHSPSTDRRAPLAAAAGGAGVVIGVLLTAGLGYIKRSCGYIDDVHAVVPSVRLLGALPDLDIRTDAETENVAVVAIQQIRSVLETSDRSLAASVSGAVVRCVTSAVANEGKTSVAIAVARAYASAGQKTLLVDADLVGRGVSSEVGMLRARGFAEVVRAGSVGDKAAPVEGVQGLWVLPAGGGGAAPDPHALSAAAVDTVFDQVRTGYEVVLVDTGPILGSVEANLTATAADETILVVSRGQHPRLAKAAVQRLKGLGVKRMGVIFNRAMHRDMQKHASSMSAASVRSNEPEAGTSVAPGARRPLAALRSLRENATETTGSDDRGGLSKSDDRGGLSKGARSAAL